MRTHGRLPNRREVVRLAATAGMLSAAGLQNLSAGNTVSLFDGKTLDGWIQVENNATSLSAAGIADAGALLARVASDSDPLSAFVREHLQDATKAEIVRFSPDSANSKAVITALVKDVNGLLSGPSIYDRRRFEGVALRPETEQLLKKNPQGYELARLNKLLLEDGYPAALDRSSVTGWTVKDGAISSTGAGRGVIYTAKDFGRFRLTFTMRHVSGSPDHQAAVLIFCSRPQPGEKPLDALAGIQFQVPNGGHWDYRPTMNNNGGAEFTPVEKTHFDPHQWSRVEVLADSAKGSARMAVAQPPGSKAVEVLRFHDPAAGKVGPIAWQMHNPGLIDEFKDVAIEVDPQGDELVSAG